MQKNDENRITIEVILDTEISGNGNIKDVFSLLYRFVELNPTLNREILSASDIAMEIKMQGKRDLSALDSLAESLEKWPKKSAHTCLKNAKKLMSNRFFDSSDNVAKLFSGFQIIENIFEKTEAKKRDEIFNQDEITNLLINGKITVSMFSEILQNIDRSSSKTNRSIFCRQLLVIRESPKRALLLSRAPDQILDKSYFYLSNLSEEEVEEQDTDETLRKKFFLKHFAAKGLEQTPRLRNLVISGQDFLFTDPEYQQALQAHFDILSLSEMPHEKEGKRKKAEELKKLERPLTKEENQFLEELDEEKAEGYYSLEDFLGDQMSIYDHPFHQ